MIQNIAGRELYDLRSDADEKDSPNKEEYETMAVILSQSGFSSAAMQQASRSYTPLLLVHLPGGQPSNDDPDGEIDTDSDSESDYGSESETSQVLRRLPLLNTTSSFESEKGRRKDAILVEGAWWNSALSSRTGILGGEMELRREIMVGDEHSSFTNEVTGDVHIKARLGIWYLGQRFQRVGPETHGSSDEL